MLPLNLITTTPEVARPTLTPTLTPREMEVLRLMSDGLTSKSIALQLNIAFKTATCHRNHILSKLGVDNTVEAMRWAIREGIVTP